MGLLGRKMLIIAVGLESCILVVIGQIGTGFLKNDLLSVDSTYLCHCFMVSKGKKFGTWMVVWY